MGDRLFVKLRAYSSTQIYRFSDRVLFCRFVSLRAFYVFRLSRNRGLCSFKWDQLKCKCAWTVALFALKHVRAIFIRLGMHVLSSLSDSQSIHWLKCGE